LRIYKCEDALERDTNEKVRECFYKRQPGIRPALVLRLKCLGSCFLHSKKYPSNHKRYYDISKKNYSKDRIGARGGLSKRFDLAKMFINSELQRKQTAAEGLIYKIYNQGGPASQLNLFERKSFL